MICNATIQERNFLSSDLVQLFVQPENPNFSWIAGQWIDFACSIDEKEYVAGYSICSPTGAGTFELVVRKSDHPVSKWLHNQAQPQDTIRIQGGSGRCVYLPEQHSNLVCIAGGIGITPLISMIRTAKMYEKPYTLYYTVRRKEELLYQDELPNAHTYVSSQNQSLSFLHIAKEIAKESNCFLCGPPHFIDQGIEILSANGIAHLHFEKWW